MEAKHRVFVYLGANTSDTFKVPMSMIGISHKPCRFEKRSPPIKYSLRTLIQTRGYFINGGLIYSSVIEKSNSVQVVFTMDSCKSHGDINDPGRRVRVVHFPLNCTRVHQLMDMGVMATTKPH